MLFEVLLEGLGPLGLGLVPLLLAVLLRVLSTALGWVLGVVVGSCKGVGLSYTLNLTPRSLTLGGPCCGKPSAVLDPGGLCSFLLLFWRPLLPSSRLRRPLLLFPLFLEAPFMVCSWTISTPAALAPEGLCCGNLWVTLNQTVLVFWRPYLQLFRWPILQLSADSVCARACALHGLGASPPPGPSCCSSIGPSCIGLFCGSSAGPSCSSYPVPSCGLSAGPPFSSSLVLLRLQDLPAAPP